MHTPVSHYGVHPCRFPEFGANLHRRVALCTDCSQILREVAAAFTLARDGEHNPMLLS